MARHYKPWPRIGKTDFYEITPCPVSLAWDSECLYFTVREPFPSRQTRCELVFGSATREQPLLIRSLMAENGVLFSD